MPVAGHLVRPTQGSNEAGRLLPFYLVLLRVGFTKLPPSPAALVSSYLTFSPLPSAIARGLGGVFSVALSLESLPLGVTQHPAPWSSDFPRTSVGAPAIVCPPRPRVFYNNPKPRPRASRPTPRSASGRDRPHPFCGRLRILPLPVELVVGQLVGERVFVSRHV